MPSLPPIPHAPQVWVDCGGGTGENVALMADYIDLSSFSHIYVVDLCPSLCAQARLKVRGEEAAVEAGC